MGSTGKTKKTSEGVTKSRGKPGSTSGSEEGVQDHSGTSECLFSILFTKKLPSGFKANTDDFASISLVDKNKLQVVVRTSQVGTYSGSKKILLSKCIDEGFVYEGKVVSTDGLTAQIKIEGHG